MQSAAAALERLTDEASQVSCHYLVDEDGTTYRIVPDAMRAWHAGVSYWQGERDINSRSIGIEIVNPGHEFGYRAFPEPQMQAVTLLAGRLLEAHAIPAARVLGHSDVAPARKQDPGELFDWKRLAAEGIGLWPEAPDDPGAMDAAHWLARYGYDTADEDMVRLSLIAFQRHFRPARFDGVADVETLGLLSALCRQAEV
jgi:N-acetylmuramoyl-L-alanine amidase